MSLVFPPSFPSWVYSRAGEGKLIDSLEAFAALSPDQWADHPHDWLIEETPAQVVDDPALDAEETPDVPVKRGPGRPRKVLA